MILLLSLWKLGEGGPEGRPVGRNFLLCKMVNPASFIEYSLLQFTSHFKPTLQETERVRPPKEKLLAERISSWVEQGGVGVGRLNECNKSMTSLL